MKTRAIAIVTAACTTVAFVVSPCIAGRDGRRDGDHRYSSRSDCDDGGWNRGHGYRAHNQRPPEVYYWTPRPVRWDQEFVGVLLGGAAGGLLGSRIGKGGGRTAATLGGTLVGAVVGGSVGRTMDRVDRLRVAEVLDSGRCREPVVWRNPGTSTRYEVTPLQTYQERDGRYCREFQTTATIGGERRQVYGTACRQPDGAWELVR